MRALITLLVLKYFVMSTDRIRYLGPRYSHRYRHEASFLKVALFFLEAFCIYDLNFTITFFT